MQLAPYLSFAGSCEEALTFYGATFGLPTCRPNTDSAFMASDGGVAGETMRGASLLLATADVSEGRRVFDTLVAGGTVTVPFAKQFWGATFGILVDRFGVSWMINAG